MTTSYKKLQRGTLEIMDGEAVSRASVWTESFIATLVVLSVIVIILESVPEIHTAYAGALHAFDFFSVAVFSVEYVLRVWSAGAKYPPNAAGKSGRREYIFSFYGLVDFFSTIPFYLQLLFPGADLRVLRMFRLLRIFKLSRYNSAFDDMIAAVKSERDSFSSAIFLMFIASLLFSSMIYIIEGHAQPEVFPSIPAAMHWFFVTIIAGWGALNTSRLSALCWSYLPKFFQLLWLLFLLAWWLRPTQRRSNGEKRFMKWNCATYWPMVWLPKKSRNV